MKKNQQFHKKTCEKYKNEYTESIIFFNFMSQNQLKKYIQSIQSNSPTISASMNENTLLYTINTLFNKDISSLDEINSQGIHSVFIYDIPEGKKEFNVDTVRKCIIDTEMKPYEGKHIFILRHFDTATLSAMNAILKLLEDTPAHAVIILEVASTKKLLDTIRSRIFEFGDTSESTSLDESTQKLLENFDPKNPSQWIYHLYSANYSRQEAILILSSVYEKYDFENQKKCQEMIGALYNSNESTKNILDNFFL
ncbi:hypothetical protein KGV55_00880 [Candidatus Gracilibacteria bacterium]|nr:hypothetical protein [Candidatus Gracilibacteria bacterium]